MESEVNQMQTLEQLLAESNSIPYPDKIIKDVQNTLVYAPLLYANFTGLKNTDCKIFTVIYKSDTQHANSLRNYVYYGTTNLVYEVHSIKSLQEVKQVIQQFKPSFSHRMKTLSWLKTILLGCFLYYVTDKKIHKKVESLLNEVSMPTACSVLNRCIVSSKTVPVPVKNTAHSLNSLINTTLNGLRVETYFHTLYNVPLDKFSEQ